MIFLIQEFVKGSDLMKYMEKQNHFNENEAKNISK